jgi:hypothetical protein
MSELSVLVPYILEPTTTLAIVADFNFSKSSLSVK